MSRVQREGRSGAYHVLELLVHIINAKVQLLNRYRYVLVRRLKRSLYWLGLASLWWVWFTSEYRIGVVIWLELGMCKYSIVYTLVSYETRPQADNLTDRPDIPDCLVQTTMHSVREPGLATLTGEDNRSLATGSLNASGRCWTKTERTEAERTRRAASAPSRAATRRRAPRDEPIPAHRIKSVQLRSTLWLQMPARRTDD